MIAQTIVIEFYVPTTSNAGHPYPIQKFEKLKLRLRKKFGGYTHFPQKGEGRWTMHGHVFRDDIEIIRVLADDGPKTRSWLGKLKLSLLAEFEQADFLITIARLELV